MSTDADPVLIKQRSLWIGCAFVMCLVGSGLVHSQPRLLGSGGAELFGHAWVQWWHGLALPAWPSGTDWAMGAQEWPVMDPLLTIFAAVLGKIVGFTAAWNVVLLLAVGLSFWGGACLADRADGDPLLGGVGLALSPIYLGSLASGLTEDAALGLLAFALCDLIFPRKPRDRIRGGVLLGFTAWCGLYLAFMGALIAVICGLSSYLGKKQDRKRILKEWVFAGVIALLVASFALLLMRGRLGGQGHHFGSPPIPVFEPLWQLNPVRSADLASFFMPGQPVVPDDALLRLHPVYFGWVLLVCAIRAGRSAWWWLVVVACLVSCGPVFQFRGHSSGISNPFDWLFSWIPFADMVNHKARLMLAGQIGLVVLAAKGLKRWKRAGHWVSAALILELVFLSPAPLPLPTTPSQVDEIFEKVDAGEGALLVLPIGGPGIHPQRPLYEQRAHARVLALRPNRPGPLPGMAQTPLGRWLFSLGQPVSFDPPQPIDVNPFLEGGVHTILVRDPWVEAVREGLGDPTIQSQGGAIWELSGLN
jgi:hypothetical protein